MPGAIIRHNVERIQLLLDAKADVNLAVEPGFTRAMLAAQIGALDTLKLLAEHGADFHAAGTTKFATTAIDRAAAYGQRQVVHGLIEQGFDWHHRNGLDATLLIAAAYGGQTDLMRDCIEHGVDPEATDRDGSTALRWAISEDRMGAVRWLIEEAKVSVDSATKAGVTPIMFAVTGTQLEAAQRLIDAGADINRTDPRHGLPPRAVAEKLGDPLMVELLKKAGANTEPSSFELRL